MAKRDKKKLARQAAARSVAVLPVEPSHRRLLPTYLSHLKGPRHENIYHTYRSTAAYVWLPE